MGRNTRAGKECRQPEVAVDRITKCRKSRTFSRDAWENGDGGAFGHDTRGDSGLCRNIAQNTNLGKKAKCDYGQAPGDFVAGELFHAFAGRSSTGASSIRMLVFLR